MNLQQKIADILWEAISPKATVTRVDESKSEIMEKIIKYWQQKELGPVAARIIDTVLNEVESSVIGADIKQHKDFDPVDIRAINALKAEQRAALVKLKEAE